MTNPAPRYAPPREDGTKPYVLTIWSWGKQRRELAWARNTVEARPPRMTGEYVDSVRRATPADVEELT